MKTIWHFFFIWKFFFYVVRRILNEFETHHIIHLKNKHKFWHFFNIQKNPVKCATSALPHHSRISTLNLIKSGALKIICKMFQRTRTIFFPTKISLINTHFRYKKEGGGGSCCRSFLCTKREKMKWNNKKKKKIRRRQLPNLYRPHTWPVPWGSFKYPADPRRLCPINPLSLSSLHLTLPRCNNNPPIPSAEGRKKKFL